MAGGTVTSEKLVTILEIEAAAQRIQGVAMRTPLLPFPELSERTGGEIRLKCESLQRTGSFKVRGATNFISQLLPDQARTGIITYSSGNHGQAIALAGRLQGIRVVVVMPTTAPAVKVEGAKALGAEVVMEGTTSRQRQDRAQALAEEEGLTIVPPFEDPRIIAGQGTVGREIVEDWPDVDVVLVPIGGGGLASGIGVAVKGLKPGVRVIGVEAEGAPTMRRALDAGCPVTLDGVDTIADGLKPVRVGNSTFRHCQEFLDDVVLVSDRAIREGVSLLLRRKLIVEFSGAATVAAVASGVAEVRGRKVAAVLSGGNLDPSHFADLAGMGR